jgi:two-component sensor histidine kinase
MQGLLLLFYILLFQPTPDNLPVSSASVVFILPVFADSHKSDSLTEKIKTITNIVSKGKIIPVQGDGRVRLRYNENDVVVSFSTPVSDSGSVVEYRYRMNNESAWRYTLDSSVFLPGLTPGSYQLIVSAKTKEGLWKLPSRLFFIIEKPFWQTLPFQAGSVVFIISIGWVTAAWYFNSGKRKISLQHRSAISELNTLRAQMSPHFLFNVLNSIQGVLLKKDPETANQYLQKFSKLLRLILEHADKAKITIAEEVETLKNYLEIELLRSDNQFSYTIDIEYDVDIYNTDIPGMIIQPFVENAIWHGFGNLTEGNILEIKFFKTQNNELEIEIRDNGIGIKKSLETKKSGKKSMGIQLVKERVDILNSGNRNKIHLSVSDLAEKNANLRGTSVKITIPIL